MTEITNYLFLDIQNNRYIDVLVKHIDNEINYICEFIIEIDKTNKVYKNIKNQLDIYIKLTNDNSAFYQWFLLRSYFAELNFKNNTINLDILNSYKENLKLLKTIERYKINKL